VTYRNSERIEQCFGSYGVELLESHGGIRVSNLYSVNAAQRVSRTIAVVRHADAIEPRFAAEHQAILDGGSIGDVFCSRGWEIRKRHLYYGEVEPTPLTTSLMVGAAEARLAVHMYVLEVAKDGSAIDYAAITELHHPNYLRVADLPAIYGRLEPRRDERLIAAMLELTCARLGASRQAFRPVDDLRSSVAGRNACPSALGAVPSSLEISTDSAAPGTG
jgi:hypothetical protein